MTCTMSFYSHVNVRKLEVDTLTYVIYVITLAGWLFAFVVTFSND